MATRSYTLVLVDAHGESYVWHAEGCFLWDAVSNLWREQDWEPNEREIIAAFVGHHDDIGPHKIELEVCQECKVEIDLDEPWRYTHTQLVGPELVFCCRECRANWRVRRA